MNKIFIIFACICISLISLSIAYYFVLFLPQQQFINTATLKKIEQQTKEANENIENIPSANSSGIEERLDNMSDVLEQQNEDMEYEQRRRGWCEQGGGTYYGNGSCITTNR